MRGSRRFLLIVPTVLVLAGCLSTPNPLSVDPSPGGILSPQTVYVHDARGQLVEPSLLPTTPIRLSTTVFSVGQPGPEPSIGITSNGYLFFQALERTMRSTDHGRTWQRVQGPLTATSSSDPYLWVDPTTDRVFQVNMGGPFGGRGPVPPGLPVGVSLGLFCSHIAWSDDYGASWLANPIDCGPVPGNDHEKLATGPWTGDLEPLSASPVYPNAVYYAYNKVLSDPVSAPGKPDVLGTVDPGLGGWIAVSLDGGATFPVATKTFDPGCVGTLHGAITAGPDGTVYIPARYCPAPLVAWSRDNGRTWQTKIVGAEAGVPDQQKNPEIAVDAENNVYLTWVGRDHRLYLSISRDHAETWSTPIAVSPPQVGSVVWPTAQAGDPGRVAFAYIGTEDDAKGPWEVKNETRWHLYYTYSINGLDGNPAFVTIRATDNDDPVQRGTICVSSSQCKDGNRNLLDFIDLTLDADGRSYVAFADGCTTPQCLRPNATPLDSRDREGVVMVLEEGPSLWVAKGELESFS